jgi:hypothetical protein
MSEKIPNKYLTNNPNVMKREIKKHGKKKDGDSSAYGPWDADYKSRKAGKGKKVKTKKSKHTKRYEEMFGEGFSYIMDESEYRKDLKKIEEEFIEFLEDLDEEDSKEIERLLYEGSQKISSPIKKALKKKSDKTGFPQGILSSVWKRGYAAWKKGHIPGTNPHQWAMARVNSFVTGGKTTKMHDKKLYQQAKANKKKKK